MPDDFTPTLPVQNEETFRQLVQGIRDYAIFMLDARGYVASWNAGAQRIKGYEPGEIIGQHFSRFYPQEALAAGWPEAELERAEALGRFEDEGWRLRKDGTRFWANVIITALRDPWGRLTGFSKVTRDLTERRRDEERLRQSEENFRLLVEGVKDHAMFMVDPEGLVQSWNAGAERMHGHRGEAIVGRHVSLLYVPEDQAAGQPAQDLRTAREAGFCETVGWRQRADGTRFWADVAITTLRNDNGSRRGHAYVVRDVSERRRMHELELESRRITEFLAMLAHELRNPLAPIGNAAAILERAGSTAQVQWCTQMIRRQVSHLSRLVDDLLDVSRITTGKIRVRRDTLDLGAVVTGALEGIRPLLTGQNHELDVQLPGEPLQMRGDATRLAQVLMNLLSNAAKFTPRGGRIAVSLQRDGAQARLHVRDNGIGMSPELLRTAFDLFVQGERGLDRSEGGLGIGLTLVRQIVQLHGGTVEAASEGPGTGTLITVRLPLVDATAPSTEPEAIPEDVATSPRSVLVVDDNADAAASLATLLRLSGHAAITAHDGHSALQLAASAPPDAVLLDIGLPGLDGYEVARRLRALPALAHTRLIAMTGYGRDEDRRAASRAGFDAHLVKPVDIQHVLRQLAPTSVAA